MDLCGLLADAVYPAKSASDRLNEPAAVKLACLYSVRSATQSDASRLRQDHTPALDVGFSAGRAGRDPLERRGGSETGPVFLPVPSRVHSAGAVFVQ